MKIDEFKKLIKEEISKNKEIKTIKEIAEGFNQPLYLVGGFLRDIFLSRKNFDLDFIVKKEALAVAEKAAKIFRAKLITMDKKHIVNYRVVKRGLSIDFSEIFNGDIHIDLARRDFTINSIAYCLDDESLYDDFNGLRDLENRLIRMVSEDAFDRDPLRMLRAARYFTSLKDFQIDKDTLSCIISKIKLITNSSSERIKEEMDKVILSDLPMNGLALVLETGLMESVFSGKEYERVEIIPMKNEEKLKVVGLMEAVNENFSSTFLQEKDAEDFKFSNEDKKVLFYSAIILLLSRSGLFSLDSDIFFGFTSPQPSHLRGEDWNRISSQVLGKGKARSIQDIPNTLKNMRFPNAEITGICKIISTLGFFYKLIEQENYEVGIRRIIHRIGRDINISICLALAISKTFRKADYDKMLVLAENTLSIFEKDGDSIINLEKLIDGKDVMKILKYKEGEEIGAILKKIRELQIENKITTREKALEFLEKVKLDCI